jgi:hypothetical protein
LLYAKEKFLKTRKNMCYASLSFGRGIEGEGFLIFDVADTLLNLRSASISTNNHARNRERCLFRIVLLYDEYESFSTNHPQRSA